MIGLVGLGGLVVAVLVWLVLRATRCSRWGCGAQELSRHDA